MTGGVTLAVCYRARRDAPLLTSGAVCSSLHRARSVADLVRLLQRMARRAPTEDLATRLAAAFEEDGVDEALVVRLSQFHRDYGADNGAKGYAVNMVWAILLQGIANGRVVIYSD